MRLVGCQLQQMPLPGLEWLMLPRLTRRAVGAAGELTARALLREAGYQVQFSRPREGDLLAISGCTGERWRVEVKTGLRGQDGKWRFLLYKQDAIGCHTDYRHSDIVLLLAVLPDFQVVPFVVPVADLGTRSLVCISSHPKTYNGWLASYRQSQPLILEHEALQAAG